MTGYVVHLVFFTHIELDLGKGKTNHTIHIENEEEEEQTHCTILMHSRFYVFVFKGVLFRGHAKCRKHWIINVVKNFFSYSKLLETETFQKDMQLKLKGIISVSWLDDSTFSYLIGFPCK